MSTFEEETIVALQNLFANIATLQQISIRDLLQPDTYQLYEQTLQEAYDALTTVEDVLTTLGIKLEYQHYLFAFAVDELTPLLIVPRSNADRVMEEFHKRLP